MNLGSFECGEAQLAKFISAPGLIGQLKVTSE